VVSDALCRFQNASDATPPDAQSVTESRKSCEVPSCPSFPQDALVVGSRVPERTAASSYIESLLGWPSPGEFELQHPGSPRAGGAPSKAFGHLVARSSGKGHNLAKAALEAL
jgi:hypothetical protein